MTRRPELDALRGLMLILIAVTHVPTRFAGWLGQPFGFVSAAEGFVFLSAFLVGAIYTDRAVRHGLSVMRAGLWRRASLIYLCQAAMLLFLFTIIALIGIKTQRQAVRNLISFYLEEPITALWTGLVMLYNPPLLDILPMYVLFMFASPLALTLGLRRGGWFLVMTVSLSLWLLAQFGITQALHAELVRTIHFRVPLHQTGAFDLMAWQLIWILGLWMGSTLRVAPDDIPGGAGGRFPAWLVGVAVVVGGGCLVWRHAVGQTPFPPGTGLNILFDKWRLGPLRLIDFFALLVLAMHFGARLAAAVRFGFLEVLGVASLPVFCAHLVMVLLLLAAIGDRQGTLPLWAEAALLAGVIAGLYVVAGVSAKMSSDDRAPERVPGAVQVKRVVPEKLRPR